MFLAGLGVPPGLLGSRAHVLSRVRGTSGLTWESPAGLGIPRGLLGSRAHVLVRVSGTPGLTGESGGCSGEG
jgi:hypothetical protein